MPAKISVQAALIAAILSGSVSFPLPDLAGVTSAEARDYYTRKRVNGQWITGRFPKRSTAKALASEPPTEAAETLPASLPPAANPAQDEPPPIAASAIDPAIQEQNRLMPLRRALEQRARSMAARGSETTSNIRSVTYDFDRDLKTVIYLDGTVTEGPLDPVTTGQTGVRP